MPINPETHVSASVILPKETYIKIQELAKKKKRSASAQMLIMIEKQLEQEKETN